MAIGDVYAFPLSVWEPEGDRDLGAFGAARILARCDEACLAGAIDTFGPDGEQLSTSSPLLTLRQIPELPGRQGNLLFRGDIPADWLHVGEAELSGEEVEIARLYNVWKDRSRPMFETMAAYDALGSVSEGLDSLTNSVAIEWRCRYELDAFLDELKPRTPAPKHVPTWAEVSKKEIYNWLSSIISRRTDRRVSIIARRGRKRAGGRGIARGSAGLVFRVGV